ncbi:DEAD/DEAH box helicase [Paenibacillus sediminis]|uniref:ATP-dependent helicase n=1 Tax=Paenibacillus sediminis TaxID=664909 RepID=A0ABS4H7N6_9BACL|nr:DEAD/DEAH box helicase [Paenibacillus sediminis]MBP1938540.1 hypothetical protein [Paenibacillus sediminis]
MNQPLYGIWLGDVFFCFSGEVSEPKVDTWTGVLRKLQLADGTRPFSRAVLRLAELRWPYSAVLRTSRRGERRTLMGRMLEGLAMTAEDAFAMLLHLDQNVYSKHHIELSPEMLYWHQSARFAQELLLRGQITPHFAPVHQSGSRRRSNESVIRGVWRPLLTERRDAERFLELAESMPAIGLAGSIAFGLDERMPIETAQRTVLYSLLSSFVDSEVRRGLKGLGYKLDPYKANYRRGSSPLEELWWNSALSSVHTIPVQGNTTEIERLTKAVTAASRAVMPNPAHDEVRKGGGFRLCIRLEPPQEEGELWYLSFWAEAADDPSLLLPAGFIWDHEEPDLEVRGKTYVNIHEDLLFRLAKAAEVSKEVAEVLLTSRPEGISLRPEELFHFLKHSAAPLRGLGVNVQMPTRLSKEGRRRAGVRIKVKSWSEQGQAAPMLGIEQLVSFELQAVLGEETITVDELTELAAANVPFVPFRGSWIEVDMKEIKSILRYLKKHEQGEMTVRELLHLAASDTDEEIKWSGLQVLDIQSETEGLLSALIEGDTLRKIPPKPVPSGLHGTLRPYQERGFQWLAAMRDLGFGACLADDMGLGKTIQVITCLLDQQNSGPALIVCPTSLLGNWQREIEKFAPSLKLHIHHGTDRLHGELFVQEAMDHNVVLTTYHLAGRDGEDLRSVSWKAVILDEAQYIKNYRTKQAQSVMKLRAPHRIAMTGTPVENRLSELWSIFQFLNPGYLGTASHFRQMYGAGTVSKESSDRLKQLRQLVRPFMLRRLKSDPDIRKDLPDKIELKSYCLLSAEQTRLYQSVVEEMMGRIDESTGIARKGLVLSSLTKLKQICDHPLLVKNAPFTANSAERSGKMMQLLELLDMIADNGEAALIFTQYVQMGELLVAQLAQKYGQSPFFLHGKVSKSERDAMVHDYQQGEGLPFFILSLKAGGVGLNLTRANHVIHYDRWWNPAVENQATDRAFRIGQNKNVQVHKLICQGTLEERIDELIESKKAMSEQVVSSGEQWLTEMSNEELRGLIALQARDLS